MLDDLEIETTIKFAIYNLILCLYEYGLDEIHLGGLLRILGVENAVAQKYDNDLVELTDDFRNYIIEVTQTAAQAGQTVH